jgi:hypothetical protein
MSLTPVLFSAFASRPRPAASQIVRAAAGRHEVAGLIELLAGKSAAELTAAEIRAAVEGNLWALTPGAFRHFLPAFMSASLESYESVSVFVSELVGALTEPSRADVVDAIERAARNQHDLGLPPGAAETLRTHQLEWIDSGIPLAVFRERADDLTPAEGAAVLAFLVALREARGADFPFCELETAIERHWNRYRTS